MLLLNTVDFVNEIDLRIIWNEMNIMAITNEKLSQRINSELST